MSDSSTPSGKTVTIVGGGIAGMTAAYYMARNGYKVTLYEREAQLGGALSAVPFTFKSPRRPGAEPQTPDAEPLVVNYEASPHMFGEWYVNFFNLMDAVGIRREGNNGADPYNRFLAAPSVRFLTRGSFPNYTVLTNNGSLEDGLDNLFSGVDTPANLFLYWYSVIDVLTNNFEGGDAFGDTNSLNGFVMGRPYGTEQVALFLEQAIMNIWSLDSYLSSVYAFQTSARYQGRTPTPTAWTITESNSYDMLIVPLERKLRELGVDIQTRTAVNGIRVSPEGKVIGIGMEMNRYESVDNLILAVPRFDLGSLLNAQGVPLLSELRAHSQDVVTAIPELTRSSSAQGAALAMLYVPLTRALPDIPERGYVGLSDSTGSLTFISLPFLARRLDAPMVLAVGISNFSAIPAMMSAPDVPDVSSVQDSEIPHNIAVFVIKEMQKYIPIEHDDVDWNRVVLKSNTSHQLYLNTVGSRLVGPRINYGAVSNLFFAVETKENPVQIATVEGAVFGGMQAARALWMQDPDSQQNTVNPIEPILPRQYGPLTMWGIKLALTPWAIAAKYVADLQAAYPELRSPAFERLWRVAAQPWIQATRYWIDTYDTPPLKPWQPPDERELWAKAGVSSLANGTLDLLTAPLWYGPQVAGAALAFMHRGARLFAKRGRGAPPKAATARYPGRR